MLPVVVERVRRRRRRDLRDRGDVATVLSIARLEGRVADVAALRRDDDQLRRRPAHLRERARQRVERLLRLGAREW